MKQISLSSLSLQVVDQGSGPVVLLVHGFPLDHSMWRSQIDALSGDFRVLAPDLRGFGGSEGEGDSWTMELLADDLAELLDVLGVSSPIAFCGLSMGGYIAWQFLRRHERRVNRLILCDTRAAPDTVEIAKGRRELAERVLHEGAAIVEAAMIPKMFAATTRERHPERILATRDVILQTRPASIAAALRGMAARGDATDLLPRISVPTLVVCGAEDLISPVSEVREMTARIPGAQFVEIADAGHMAPLEQPETVTQALHEFLAGTSSFNGKP